MSTQYQVWVQIVVLEHIGEKGKQVVKRRYAERDWGKSYGSREEAEREAKRLNERWGHPYVVKEFIDASEPAGRGDGERSLPTDADAGLGYWAEADVHDQH